MVLKSGLQVKKVKFNDKLLSEESFRIAEEEVFPGAVKEFLRVLHDIVPVWSGHALGAFLPLAAAAGVGVDDFEVEPVTNKGKGIAGGLQDAATAGMSGTRMRDYISKSKNIWTLRISTVVKHHEINEVMNVNPFGFRLKNPGPWNSFPPAEAAAHAFIQDQFPKSFSRLHNWVEISKIWTKI